MIQFHQGVLRYYEFKLDVDKQTVDRQTDLVREVAPPEVGQLKTRIIQLRLKPSI